MAQIIATNDSIGELVSSVSIWTDSRPKWVCAAHKYSSGKFLLTSCIGIVYGRSMSQRNSHCRTAEMNRLATVDGLLQVGGTLIITLVLVLLISHGGAG